MMNNGAGLAPTPFLDDDDDLYQLRCAYLHSGHEVLDRARARRTLARVRFAYPSAHGFYGHYVYVDSGAFVQVQIDEFCEELCAAAESWLRTTINARPSGPWNTANMLTVLSVEEAISMPHRPLWDVQYMRAPQLPRP